MPTRFKKLWIPATALILLILALLYLRPSENSVPQENTSTPIHAAPLPTEEPATIPIGDAQLSGYGSPSSTPAQDLEKFGHALEGLLLLFKNLDTRFIATNVQLAAFMRGENPENLVFISPGQPVFNSEGLLIDHWQTPLIVHPLATGLIEIRSAGPDRTPYNDDDLIFDPGIGRTITSATLDSMPPSPSHR